MDTVNKKEFAYKIAEEGGFYKKDGGAVLGYASGLSGRGKEGEFLRNRQF